MLLVFCDIKSILITDSKHLRQVLREKKASFGQLGSLLASRV